MGILSKSSRCENGSHSRLYYGLKDFGYEVWWAKGKILGFLIVIGLWCFMWLHSSDIINGINQMEKNREMIDETNMRIHSMVTTSTDCFVLQQNILILISKGANAESWFADDQDNDLKIGKERYGVLGCH